MREIIRERKIALIIEVPRRGTPEEEAATTKLGKGIVHFINQQSELAGKLEWPVVMNAIAHVYVEMALSMFDKIPPHLVASYIAGLAQTNNEMTLAIVEIFQKATKR